MKEENVGEVGTSYDPNGKNLFKLGFISDNISHLLGEVLTVIDASLEGDKNKAVKDLLREKFSKKQDWFCEVAWKDTPQGSETNMPIGKAHQEWHTGVIATK